MQEAGDLGHVHGLQRFAQGGFGFFKFAVSGLALLDTLKVSAQLIRTLDQKLFSDKLYPGIQHMRVLGTQILRKELKKPGPTCRPSS